ncbi:MAG: hypothetical protein FJ279_09890 [Planctomycetes bacterium]|nr:hypothetical protein [Planctomycetota bacterium]
MNYCHTQRAPLWAILVAVAVALVLAPVLLGAPNPAVLSLLGVGLLVAFVAFCLQTLTVRDEGTHLTLRYGPIPVFRHRIPYDAMTEAKRARSSWIDGWGIHWAPGRGWIYNLWGFDCVEIRLGQKLVRVGTDDPDGLTRFLDAKIRGLGKT